MKTESKIIVLILRKSTADPRKQAKILFFHQAFTMIYIFKIYIILWNASNFIIQYVP